MQHKAYCSYNIVEHITLCHSAISTSKRFFCAFFNERRAPPVTFEKMRKYLMRVVRIVQQLQNAELDYSKLNTFFFFLQRKRRKGAKSRPPDRFLNRKRGPPWRERERDLEALPRGVTKELIKCSANCPEQSEPLHLPKLEPP